MAGLDLLDVENRCKNSALRYGRSQWENVQATKPHACFQQLLFPGSQGEEKPRAYFRSSSWHDPMR
jgi:hypothetical protein